MKTKYPIDETHKAYEARYTELQHTIRGLRRSVSTRETIDEICYIFKKVYEYIKNPNLMTTNDVSGQIMINFSKTFKKLEESKAMFEEKSNPSFLKGERPLLK